MVVEGKRSEEEKRRRGKKLTEIWRPSPGR
jgi:hypothetical protein